MCEGSPLGELCLDQQKLNQKLVYTGWLRDPGGFMNMYPRIILHQEK